MGAELKAPLDRLYSTINGPVGVEPLEGVAPTGHIALQALPNPLNSTTYLTFALTRDATLRLDIYDAAGRRVRTVAADFFEAGQHRIHWDGLDAQGRPPSAGIYFARLVGEKIAGTCRLTVLR